VDNHFVSSDERKGYLSLLNTVVEIRHVNVVNTNMSHELFESGDGVFDRAYNVSSFQLAEINLRAKFKSKLYDLAHDSVLDLFVIHHQTLDLNTFIVRHQKQLRLPIPHS